MTPFLQTRISGEALLETVFWRDMLLVGTIINVACTVAAFALIAAGYPAGLGVAVNFLPVPWNLFLLFAVWRSADREGGPPAVTAKVVGVVWFVAMIAL